MTLTEQELSVLTPGQQAMAKDWHLVNKKLDWIISKVVEHNNTMAEHDSILETHKTFIKVFKYVIPIMGGLIVLVVGIVKLIKIIWGI